MSFMGGSECSTAGNPLGQFTKHVQDDKSLQRDRLVGRGPAGMQGMRSVAMNGSQDNMMNDFMQQGAQMPQMQNEALALDHMRHQEQFDRQNAHMRASSQSPANWAQEFNPADQARMEAAFQKSVPFTQSDISRFHESARDMNRSSPAPQMSSTMGGYQRPMMMGMGGMGMGMPMGTGMGMMNQPMYNQNQQQNMQEKGKGKMIELDDENWEAQFAQIDLQGQGLEQDDAIEKELNEMDRQMVADKDQMGDFDQWDGFEGLNAHAFQDPQLGEYMFEEENIFKDITNPFEEGVRITNEGGNLSLAALAFEAAVQRDPQHVEAWCLLGSAQAQNEKETPAVRALEQALKLDPNNLGALMGLAVSYTNEGYDSTAYRILERWLSVKYPQIIPPNGLSTDADIGFTDRHQLHEKVTNYFIQAAQLSPDGDHMDPDVQVGLGVLFYGQEEYDKAVDCFGAALASHESGTSNQQNQLHLLWNRLGATLANSGRSEEAIAAYEKALTLRENFVRARYNLGVSCVNIGCYDEAAAHLLGALSMHRVVEREGREKARELAGSGGPGMVSEAELERMISQNQSTNLYDTLRRVFSQMGRRDLAERVVVGMDVETFRGDFDF